MTELDYGMLRDAHLRYGSLDDMPYGRAQIGQAVFAAIPWDAGALIARFSQAFLFGFRQLRLDGVIPVGAATPRHREHAGARAVVREMRARANVAEQLTQSA